MKKYLLFFFLIFCSNSFAQNYEKSWDKIVQFENEDRLKPALQEVEVIYKKAILKKDEIQIIKCFFYKSKFIQSLEEDAQNKIIHNLESEITKVSIPSKAILNIVYAQCLKAYLDLYNYKIYGRTKLDSMSIGDISSWTISDFEQQIEITYNKTLAEDAILKKTPLTNYEPIFDFLSKKEFDKMSLYDYIIEENIAYYKSKCNEWEKITFTNPNLLGSNEQFIKTNTDSIKNAPIKKVIELYQKINYVSEPSELELDRLLFCNKFLLKDNKSMLLKLDEIKKKCKDTILTQNILYEKAQIYNKLANKKKPFTDYKIKSVALLDSILSFSNKSNAFKKANELKREITSKDLDVEMLKYWYEKENTRAYINYKGVDSIRISFYKINSNLVQKNNLNNDTLADIISKKKCYRYQKYTLKNNLDYFNYSTEVVLPQLEVGQYLVYVEDLNASKTNEKNDYKIITVSNSCVTAHTVGNKVIYKVVNRKTGKPIENCQLKSNLFNSITNGKGVCEFFIDKQNETYNYKNITVINEKDTLITTNDHYLTYFSSYDSSDKNYENRSAKVTFYLDRAIYRPGQTVFYKGIASQNINGKNNIIPNLLIKLIITDASNDELKSFDVMTNEYGSFSGEFIIPKTALSGNFEIEADEPDDYENDLLYDKLNDEHPIWDNSDFKRSSIRFKVEEYKRPKFEVLFEPIKVSYNLNQTITIKGNAKAYAGSAISNATVKYRIERESKNAYDYNTTRLSISETTTDSEGNFSINFDAIPSNELKKESLPIFSFRIFAEITDLNGETHTAETTVKVGYHALALNIDIPKKITTGKENLIYLNSTNLNNVFSPINGELRVYFIKPFENKFKRRIFYSPEIQSISNEDFERLFPNEINSKSDDNEIGTLVYSKKINTDKEKVVALDFMNNFKSGYYKIVFSATDKFDNLIETNSTFQLNQSKDIRKNTNELVTIQQLNEDPAKDGFVKIQINSAIPEIYLSCSAVYQNALFFEKDIIITDYQTEISIPINKNIKNYFTIGIETIVENQNFISETNVKLIHETAPKLTFEYASFRDKLEPGKTENWSFKIKGDNQESEVLASMYDASLDTFADSYWRLFDENYYLNQNYRGKSQLSFGNVKIYLNYYFRSNTIEFRNEDTKLIWFGFDFKNSNNYNIKKEYKKLITKKAKKPFNAKHIMGQITDNSGPLPSANVIVKGTNRSVQTDIDGFFEIEAASGEILIVTYAGYEEKTIVVGASKTYSAKLKESASLLDEVVVMAMGMKRRSDAVVSSQQRIVETTLHQKANTTVLQTLAGKISGIQINKADNNNPKNTIVLRGNRSITGNNEALIIVDGVISSANNLALMQAETMVDVNVINGLQGAALYGEQGRNGVVIVTTKKGVQDLTQVKSRTNLSETAFFFPQLKTDIDGKVSFNFNSPEALTQWKFRLFAHNKKGDVGYLEKKVITQKDLMIFPNMPRFLREKDTITITAKITNLTANVKTGMALLQLFDATNMESIDNKTMNTKNSKTFTILPSGNTIVKWTITIPEGVQSIQYKIVAKADDYSDGEESILPVLTNNLLITESIPLWVKGKTKKTYTFNNLKNNTSNTFQNHLFTLEYASNPTWIALQSLPYLMEYEHECAEQTFARYYSNVLATEIINNNPKIATVFEDWRKSGKPISKLNQNEELKSLVMAETPWLKDLGDEENKRKELSLLFDIENMKLTTESTLKKLKEKQKSSGGFAWFDGGSENEYVTCHIAAGLGHLQKLKVNKSISDSFIEITKTAIPYLDSIFIEKHKQKNNSLNIDLYYLYTRTFYLESFPISDNLKPIIKQQIENIKLNWSKYSIYGKGMAALILSRFKQTDPSKKILLSLKESASNNEDWGMYWIENKSGWNWDEAPIETQALLIEAFAEINNDTKSVDAMKVWLLKNKQTKNWPTTKSTTEAIYALLMNGSDWLSIKDNTTLKIGDETVLTNKLPEIEKTAESGYLKMDWKANEIKPEMATVVIENKSEVPGFGGLYWQYFEDLDKVKNYNGGILSVSKELYIKKSTEKGWELEKINSQNPLKIGDLITVRLTISVKEDMEYVHLKDMRASCFEPIAVQSKYTWKDGLGFYFSTKDAATHFFFDVINKGIYVLEYDIRVNNSGTFSNGITTIENMYAPEFTSHTKGIQVNVKE